MIDYEILKDDIREIRTDIREKSEAIETLRKRTHVTENNLASSSHLIAETISNLSRAVDDIDVVKKKQEESERTIRKIEIVTSNWKPIFILIIISVIIGFCMDHGLKDFIRASVAIAVPDKISKAMGEINHG